MKRWIRMILVAMAAALCLSLPVHAYDYELDPETGEPIGSGNADKSYYEMADGGRYVYDTSRYVYQTGSVEFAASVPNHAVVGHGQTVSLWPGNASSVLLYRDGNLVEKPMLQNIAQAGSYVVNVTVSEIAGDFTFAFTIVPELTNQFTDLNLPEDFLLDYVLLDTVPQELPYGDFYHFGMDGEYEIRYSCAAVNRTYVLRFTLDTAPPVLTLPGITDGEAHNAVTVTVPEEGAYIEINCDGAVSTLRGSSKELRQPGRYQLKVYDEAGNMTQYDFTIRFYLDISAGVAILLLVAALAGVAVYCHLVRKNARVG